MDLIWYAAVCSLCGAVFSILHIVIFRTRKVRSINRTCGVLAIAAGIVGGATGWILLVSLYSSPETALLGSVAGSLTFVGFAGVYTLIVPVSADRSISAHMVMRFLDEPSRTLSEEELARRYPPQEVFRKRIGECVDIGVLANESGRYRLTRKGIRIARFFRSVASLLRIEIIG